MNETILVRIIITSSIFAEHKAFITTIPGEEGEFGVLPRHAPLIANLKPGIVKILEIGGNFRYFIYGGIAEVTAKGVNIVTEFAIDPIRVNKDEIIEKISSLKYSVKKEYTPMKINLINRNIAKYESLLLLL